MDAVLLAVVLVGTVVALSAGMYFTLRGFRASDQPPIEVTPPVRRNPHDAATTAQLKHFFQDKECASCGQPIAPVHAFERHPGILNPRTHQALEWDEIPAENLSATLDTHVPLCPSCAINETFRQNHPELVVDRHRPIEHPSH